MDHVIGQDVRFRIPFYPVERAKAAELFADIGVVDIAVDDIADDVVGMKTSTHPVGTIGQLEQVRLFEELNRLIRTDP